MGDNFHNYTERLRKDPALREKLIREIAKFLVPKKEIDHFGLECLIAEFFGFADCEDLHGRGVIMTLCSSENNQLGGMLLKRSKLGRKGPVVYYFPTDKLKMVYQELVVPKQMQDRT